MDLRYYYTITSADVGRRFIKTLYGSVCVAEFMGPVQRQDVGKRIYRTRTEDRTGYVWQVENNEQRDERERAK